MTDIIRLLPDSVANQIAAGEVIQRPASVVKELVENAIDAGADHIILVINEAGRTLVQVIDNGKGMSETDARFAFERHATSKITSADDLFSLNTMGFRGEALASIAAVAQVSLKTRTSDNELGVQVDIEGAKIVDTQPVAAPIGTNISVKNLFFNVPARRKFLKSNHTEFNHIYTEFERIVLAYPNVHFELIHNKMQLKNLSSGSFKHRIVELFGRKLGQQLLPVEVETTLVKLEGFVSTPESAHKKGLHQFFFTNGRYMRNAYFQKAVMMAFDRLIPLGEQVHFFLNIEVEPQKIDVNIHPAKTEIKFEDDKAIFQIILAAVRAALGKFNAVPMIDFDTNNKPDIPVFDDNLGKSTIPEESNAVDHFGAEIEIPSFTPSSSYNPFEQSRTYHEKKESKPYTPCDDFQTNFSLSKKEEEMLPETNNDLFPQKEESNESAWSTCSFECYQYRGQFIVTNVQDGLLLVDQHRASIKIFYEKIQKINHAKQHVSQGLLFPEMIELTPAQTLVFERVEKDLLQLGFEFSTLGNNCFSINAVPEYADGVNPTLLLENLLDDTKQEFSDIKETIINQLSLKIAQRVALPIGQVLNSNEMSTLVNDLFSCELPNYTPNGKLIYTILSQDKINDIFN